MNGIKHELGGSAAAAAAAAAAATYSSPLLYAPTPSWMGTDAFSGKAPGSHLSPQSKREKIKRQRAAFTV